MISSCISEKKQEDNKSVKAEANTPERTALHRPQYHYTSFRNWFNDPNGLIYHKGLYHMYYQYNPYGTQWGHMSWGHATSKDLIFWNEEKVAIPEDKHMIFSGTTAVSPETPTALCDAPDCIVAAYTSFEYELDENKNINALAQHQSLAFSKDGGYTFEKYKNNPVLDIGSKEFRDPKIFYHTESAKWIMLVSLADQHAIAFYTSKDLLNWTEVSRFGNIGNVDSVWECPDLFKLNYNGQEKWVLTLSAGHPSGPGFYAMQYFIGSFNGMSFKADALDYPRYLDFGKDFYAGITFANTNNLNRATMISWLGCHVYTKDTPTTTWRGAMSLPRDLYLDMAEDTIILKSKPPLHYIKPLIQDTFIQDKIEVNGNHLLPIASKSFVSAFKVLKDSGSAGIEIFKSDSEKTVIGFDFDTREAFIDRRGSGDVSFNKKFPSIEVAPVVSKNKAVSFTIFADESVVEVFVNDGETAITNRVFPSKTSNKITLFTENGTAQFSNISVSTLKSIWN
ncbi:glycoside hydrolase family 32 protein [Seonamhaeicola sp.]|uniref:glycoside hydrolase family 32 protein n=1 Tax=Seonamhaeicola sp. TaxID=1912245 RepID=UPI00260FFAE4|nr:glycoside hydrolase family 32 protein [Seonamhaeicola sp.]